MKKTLIFIFLLSIVGLTFFLISNQKTKLAQTRQTEIASSDSLVEFLKQNKATPEITEAYLFARENPEGVLSTVKCYCGCLKNQEHKNNKDCFFNENGSFDLMGLNCGLCVKTALLSKQMLKEGKTVQEISDFVDARWGENL